MASDGGHTLVVGAALAAAMGLYAGALGHLRAHEALGGSDPYWGYRRDAVNLVAMIVAVTLLGALAATLPIAVLVGGVLVLGVYLADFVAGRWLSTTHATRTVGLGAGLAALALALWLSRPGALDELARWLARAQP